MVNRNPIRMVNRIPILRELLMAAEERGEYFKRLFWPLCADSREESISSWMV
jgi:hypothetical protein